MDDFFQQLRLAARSLARAPGFTLTAVITLALGIGLSTAVFTIADALLIRRLPIAEQDRVAVLWSEAPGRFASLPLRIEDARELAQRTQSLELTGYVGYYGTAAKPIRDGDRVYRLRRAVVSGNFFDVLRSPPILGRALRSEDDVAGAASVVVLSHRAWQQQYGGDSGVVGRTLVMHDNSRAYTIVGVMPQGLDYPRGTDFWTALVPASTGPGSDSLHLTSPSLHVTGRLKPGASLADAQAELTSYFTRPDALVWQRGLRGAGESITTLVLGNARDAVVVFAAAAGLLLLLTCINVANLLLVRGLGRAREIAVRSALGAGRSRIARQLLTESALLAIAGGVLGTALGVAAVQGFVAIAPSGLPRVDEVRVSAAVVLAAAAITAVAMLVFALAPAIMTSRVTMQDTLRAGARQAGGGRRLRAATEALVAGQVALAVVVLFAAGLMTRSLIKLQHVDLAFEPRQVLIAELALRSDRLGGKPEQVALLDALLSRISAMPQVEAVSPTLAIPFAGPGAGIHGALPMAGQTPEDAARNPVASFEVVAPNYFATLGIPVLHGRALSDDDREGSTPVVVISESLARHYWPGADPLGKQFQLRSGTLTVVGVVPDTRYNEMRTARPSAYFPVRQSFFPVGPMTLIIRTSSSSADVVPALRRAIAEADPNVALARAVPIETLMGQERAQPRLNAVLLSIFACAAVLLAAVGLFGIIATMVRQRTREIGIRMALGATGTAMRRMVIARGLLLATVGTLAGIAAGLAANRRLAELMFEVSPADPPTLAIVAAVMLAVAGVASLVPAQASARVDPAIALRSEL